jgi:hypothetical protein
VEVIMNEKTETTETTTTNDQATVERREQPARSPDQDTATNVSTELSESSGASHHDNWRENQ